MSFNDSQEISLSTSFYFFQKLDLGVLANSEKFSPDIIGVNFEVLKLLHLCMDCHEVCLK